MISTTSARAVLIIVALSVLSTCVQGHMRLVGGGVNGPTPKSTSTALTAGPCGGLQAAALPPASNILWTGQPFNLSYLIQVAHAPYLPMNMTIIRQIKIGLTNLSSSAPYSIPKQSSLVWVTNRTGTFSSVITLPEEAQCYPCFLQLQQPTLAESYYSCADIAVFSHANDQTITLTVQKETGVAIIEPDTFRTRLFASYGTYGFNAGSTTTPTAPFVLNSNGQYSITFTFTDNTVNFASTMADVIRAANLQEGLGINVVAVSGGTNGGNGGGGNDGGKVAGAVIGGIVGVGLIGFCWLYARKHSKLCYAS